jgi:hypothetical protein
MRAVSEHFRRFLFCQERTAKKPHRFARCKYGEFLAAHFLLRQHQWRRKRKAPAAELAQKITTITNKFHISNLNEVDTSCNKFELRIDFDNLLKQRHPYHKVLF